MEQIITCINCPVGCRMDVTLSETGEVLKVSPGTPVPGEKNTRSRNARCPCG